MNKRNIKIIGILFVVIVALMMVKGVLKPKNVDSTIQIQGSFDLQTEYERIKSTNKPSIIIFSYDADRCEDTKKFFEAYNTKAKQIMNDYKEKFETLFINTGTLLGNDGDFLIEIAKENDVSELPSILLLDREKKPFKVIEGPFDEDELKKIMNGLVK